jgi:hypothetical protein
VEQFLFQENIFGQFAQNVAKLPISDKSVLIRAILRGGWGRYVSGVGNYRTATVLEKVSVFLDDYKAGRYADYWSLINTHYIAPGSPAGDRTGVR